MADINLKDEKRISVNGEYDLVTTHPNNEPIYRSNGHQLELNVDNSDYLDLNSSINIVNDGDYFKTVIEIDNSTEKLFVSDESDLSSYISITPTGRFKIVSKGNFQQITPSAPFNGKAYIKIYKSGGDIFFEVNGTTENKGAYNFIFDSIFFGKRTGSAFVSQKIILVDNNNETFNPTNINSNAQIEGSNGTIAQVNSSAADPINYILGTVFQKRGFALGFDKLNKEHIKLNEIELLDGDSWNTKIQFLENKDLNIYSVDFFGSNKSRFSVFGSLLQGGVVDNLGNSYTFNYSFSLGIFYNIEIKKVGANLLVKIDGSEVLNQPFPNSFIINSINNRENNIIYSTSFLLQNIKFNNENYPLKRGLGVELIGSNGTTLEIKTSVANPQQRVNFGMWLKGDNLNGWNPYTV